MRNVDQVLRELGQLYDFQKELAKFRLRPAPRPERAPVPSRPRAARRRRSASSER